MQCDEAWCDLLGLLGLVSLLTTLGYAVPAFMTWWISVGSKG